MPTFTLYVQPASTDLTGRVNVYAIPHEMRPGQHPRDLREEYQALWKQAAIMQVDYAKRRLTPAIIFDHFIRYSEDIQDLSAGAYLQIDAPQFRMDEMFGTDLQDRMKAITAGIMERNYRRSCR